MSRGNNKSALHNWFSSDYHFNHLYPEAIREFADRNWTPLNVVKMAAKYLACSKKSKILDIGSGAGKFCIAAAWFQPQSLFFGVEQKLDMVKHAQKASNFLGIRNATFIHGDVTTTDFGIYDGFYFYNSFYEYAQADDRLNASQQAGAGAMYDYYHQYLMSQADKMPAGTKIASYYSLDRMPAGFVLEDSLFKGLLKFWLKDV